ncbi:thioredoxin domain-containing protein [Bosea sp. (in: a-proteobacteria)]|uniref:thioredoxin domain-containing protein n=1 Tax=Bosea sp. (in: a-proteobacteria) TaxID=1871050 RepID=UPI0026301923|nr:thioredoxin domain-containing protein [Bosea sp. (in: a-proteobacteria)]MCO5090508.1 thioredoxin domain-containing protein [Bosea sp. (in: a-proteobacteria)]
MNRLAEAASPYLLQHRDNPVDWWEWSPEAFAEARLSNRPVLLSIGYAACHWCHVMAHESFENPATAAVMNELFVNIKVDREERPDIDHVYMSALHSLGEQGGWPLTMFLTPEGDPFWGGTYFPPEPRHGRPSFTGILRQLATIWQAEPQRIAGNAEAIRAALKQMETTAPAEAGVPDLDQLAGRIAAAFDPVDGGLRGAPKFPNAGLIELTWRRGTQDPAASASLTAATLTLQRMARGGIRDHLGGGFARYAVDEHWLVPHFEKMLYDNAQLLGLYALEAGRSGDPLAWEAAEGIVAWLEREMLLPEGAFAASLDADSEGVEGKYYLWTEQEIVALLGPTEAALFARHYDVRSGGNWEGANILNRLDTPDPDATEAARLGRSKARLLAERANRMAPARDDKILADWNGLAIAALARAAGLLDRPHWLALAKDAYRFVAESMADGEGLAHSCRTRRLIRPGFALDHAAMIDAALALHDASFDPHYLSDARRWSQHLWRHYRDPDSGLIGMTRLESAGLPVAPRPSHDDAVPNALGVHAANLVRIARKTGSDKDRARAEELMKTALAAAARAPMAHGSVLNACDLARNGVEIVLAGPKREALHAAARRLPYTLVTLVDGEAGEALPADHPAAAMLRQAGEGAAFICFEGRCLPPVTDPNRLAAAIAAGV